MSYDLQRGNGQRGNGQRGNERVRLDITGRRPALTIALGSAVYTVEELVHAGDAFELRIDGRMFRGRRCVTSDSIQVRLEGQTFVFQRPDRIQQTDAAAGNSDEVRAIMPGTIVACHVEAGVAVSHGAALVTLESMKVQLTVTAPRAGIVSRVHFAENATFERDAVLVSLMPAAAGDN